MDNREKNFVSAVVYVHDCQDRISIFLENVLHTLSANFAHSEIICVNDYSRDGSVDVIRTIRTRADALDISVAVVNMSCFHGLELAMNAGLELAIGDYVFEFDSTEPDWMPEDVMTVYARAMQGYDIVSAAPEKRQSLSSRIFYRTFQRYSPMPYKMHTESFRMISRRAIKPHKRHQPRCAIQKGYIRKLRSALRRDILYAEGREFRIRRYAGRTRLSSSASGGHAAAIYRRGVQAVDVHDGADDACHSVHGCVLARHFHHRQPCGRLDDDDTFSVVCVLRPLWHTYGRGEVSANTC